MPPESWGNLVERRLELGDIGQEVRQGCLSLPTLFSICAEEMMLEAFYKTDLGVKAGGMRMVDVRFADE